MRQQDKIFVIAGNINQFKIWQIDNEELVGRAVYVSRPDIVRGMTLRPDQVVRYGTWYERKDLDEILRAVDGSVK